MSKKLPPFYPIFDSVVWLERLLPLGIQFVQLRIKNKEETELIKEIKRAKTLCDATGCILVVNDYWQIAVELRCNFIHLGQEDLDRADISLIKSAGIKVGVSTHSEAELQRALTLQPDYIALGPIYPTILKDMPWQPQGVDQLGIWKKEIGNIPLVAIGGMSVERASSAYKAGADVVSVVTDITLNNRPEDRVRAWLNLIQIA